MRTEEEVSKAVLLRIEELEKRVQVQTAVEQYR